MYLQCEVVQRRRHTEANFTYDEELCTHVPPSSRRVPTAVGMPVLDAAEGSWFNKVIVLASSYVVPPIIKMMTS